MPNQTEVKLDSVDITIDHRDKTVRLFDWSAMEQVVFYASDWNEIKYNIDKLLGGQCADEQKTDKPSKDIHVKADKFVVIDPSTGNKHQATSYGLVPICNKCDKAFAAYEKDDEGFVCRSCRLPKTKNGYTTSTMHVSNINIEDMQNLIKK